jgi:alpha-glucosidase (family GH31 glycosyl hydrolase)
MKNIIKTLFITQAYLLTGTTAWAGAPDSSTVVEGPGYRVRVVAEGLRWSVERADGKIIAPAHPASGLVVNGSTVKTSAPVADAPNKFTFTTEDGTTGDVEFQCKPHRLRALLQTAKFQATVELRTGPMGPAYGLGDAAIKYESGTKITNFKARVAHEAAQGRWVSPFVIFPASGFAGAALTDKGSSVTLNSDSYGQIQEFDRSKGAWFDYFIGTPTEIYAAFQKARQEAGYPDTSPRFPLFELGWESWDALRWDTNAATVQKILERFIADGYPIRWAVTGSGFWKPGHCTTSFGQWNSEKYPDPKAFKAWLNSNKIRWLIGQRTNFIALGGPHQESGATDNNRPLATIETGPYTEEGLQKGYFQMDWKGNPIIGPSSVFPKAPCHLLDGRVPGAAQWFADLFAAWGVDGIKEDTMIKAQTPGIFNAPVQELERRGALVMARNGFLSSPGTLLRINDTYIDEIANRIPINFLQYAACGAPNVYADPVGFGGFNTNRVGSLRMAWLTALTAGMALGTGPWEWPETERAWLKKACDFHYQIAPYLYSAAVDSFETGFPHTMTPMPIAFPNDPETYDLTDKGRQQFQWMAGPSLLATPFAKSNYKTSNKMNIYLPAGRWMDYETGQVHTGPTTLEDFEMPLDKIPAFVGGKGILVLRDADDKPLRAAVFPVAPPAGSYVFTFPDGKGKATIKNAFTEWILGKMRVTDTASGKQVPHEVNDKMGAVTFAIEANHTYRISAN